MEDEETQTTGTQSKTNAQSPSEVKDNMKEKVARGVAAVAGAIKGFSEEAKRSDLAGSTKDAIQKAGETTREIASAAKTEYKTTKDELKGTATGSKVETDQYGSRGSYGSTSSSSGATGTHGAAGGSTTWGAGPSADPTPQGAPRSAEMRGDKPKDATLGDMPDLRKSDVAKSDRELEE